MSSQYLPAVDSSLRVLSLITWKKCICSTIATQRRAYLGAEFCHRKQLKLYYNYFLPAQDNAFFIYFTTTHYSVAKHNRVQWCMLSMDYVPTRAVFNVKNKLYENAFICINMKLLGLEYLLKCWECTVESVAWVMLWVDVSFTPLREFLLNSPN